MISTKNLEITSKVDYNIDKKSRKLAQKYTIISTKTGEHFDINSGRGETFVRMFKGCCKFHRLHSVCRKFIG